MSKINIIAICGEAGSGKDWLLNELSALYPHELAPIISTTTRPKRENEVNGVNYYFVSEEEFFKLTTNGDMLEATSFNGWFYGTTLNELSEDKTNIGVFSPAGIEALLANPRLNVLVVRVLADPKVRLIRQLNREKYPNINEIIRRYYTDNNDFEILDFIVDYAFYNDWLDMQADISELTKYLEDRYMLGQK